MNKTIAYLSLGCKVNLYESNALLNKFLENGFTQVSFNKIADVYLINTCTVTSTSDSKSRKIIRRAIKTNKEAIICVMGCFVQLNPDEVLKIDGVDIICGTSNRILLYDEIIKLLDEKASNTINLVEDYKEISEFEDLGCLKFNDKTRGFVKIQDGCNNFCTYCAIPYARGTSRSRDPESIINEVKLLTENEVKEIVLSGINTGNYNYYNRTYLLADLLHDLIKKVPNLSRIRISSIEVTEISDKLISIINEFSKYFCDHLHIPLQSGHSIVLKEMNRMYDCNYYFNKIKEIRSKFPNFNITSDILVGFNYETNEIFEESFDFIKSISFGEIHVFPYSPRVNTLAYKNSEKINFSDKIDDYTKTERVNKLLKLNEEKALEYRNKFINQVLIVLIEIIKNGYGIGYSSNYIQIKFKINGNKVNDFVKIKLTKVCYPISIGEIINV